MINGKKEEKTEAEKAKAFINSIYELNEKLEIPRKIEELQKKDDKVYYGVINKDSNWDGYGFKLENIEKIEPISVNGQLGIWEYEYTTGDRS